MAAPSPPGQGQGLGASDQALCDAYDAGLYDLDGVIYLGPQGIAHAAASVAAARARGLRSCFVTNNASRAPAEVASHLQELGVPAEPGDVVTSAQAAVQLVRERVPVGAAVLVVGSTALDAEVQSAGLRPVRTVAQAGPAGVVAVVQGLAPDTSWADLAEACVAIRGGALWVAGNTDSTLPSPRGPLPGNGALVAALVAATQQQPVVAGKPEPALHRASVARVGARRPLVIGDRLDTDVLGAVRGGCDSLLVLTGVTDRAALLAAPAGRRPTYVASDLRGLLVAHRPAQVRDGRATCGRASASYDRAGRMVVRQEDPDLEGPGRAVTTDDRDVDDSPQGDGTQNDGTQDDGRQDDGLRAACALAWSAAPA